MKRMLINATQPEEVRVAMVDGQHLYDLDIEVPSKGQKKASIYKAKITRIEPSLEAAFIDYGADRHGFLPFKEVARHLFATNDTSQGKMTIKEALHEGQEFIVQVEKEERGNKGAALTTFVSLAGRYLVLMPNNPRAGGISRRVEGEERADLREALSTLDVPDGMGLIVRTAGVGRSAEELQWDLDYLLQLWEAVDSASTERAAPFLIYQESNLIIRAIRDYFRQEIGEILVDSQEVYEEACDFMGQVMKHNLNKVKLYSDDIPLFNRYQIESQIESAFGHSVRLPSGGSVVIDHTEALISIDINSARATKGSDIEETALNTNLEAADEVARQLRLRDIGGLIVIDFIDMGPPKNQREVENRLRDALEQDRARVQIGRISRFGLLEMSRQRLRPSLGDSSQLLCPRCNGQGNIRSTRSMALSILRVVEEDAIKENTGDIVVKLPLEVATFLLNEKRDTVHEIETRQKVRVILVPDPTLQSPNYLLERVRKDDGAHEVHNHASYELATESSELPEFLTETNKPAADEPAVKAVPQRTPAPTSAAAPEVAGPGLLSRVWTSVFGAAAPVETVKPVTERPQRRPGPRSGAGRGQSRRRGQGQGQGRRSSGSRSEGQREQSKNENRDDRPSTGEKNQRNPRRERGQNASDKKPAQREADGNKVSQRDNAERDGNTTPSSNATPNGNTAPSGNTTPDGDAPDKNGNKTESGPARSGNSRSGSRRGRRGGRGRNRESSTEATSNDGQQKEAVSDKGNGQSSDQNSSGKESDSVTPVVATSVAVTASTTAVLPKTAATRNEGEQAAESRDSSHQRPSAAQQTPPSQSSSSADAPASTSSATTTAASGEGSSSSATSSTERDRGATSEKSSSEPQSAPQQKSSPASGAASSPSSTTSTSPAPPSDVQTPSPTESAKPASSTPPSESPKESSKP